MKGPVVVVDAANGVGRAVAQAALDGGRPLIAVSADRKALRWLREQAAPAKGHGNGHAEADLTLIEGSIADEASSTALANSLRELDRPIAGIVVANCSEPTRGRILDQPALELQRRLEADLLPQLAAARQLLPLLAEAGRNGGYVLIGSPGSEHPWAGYGYRSISAAAVSMLMRVLHLEARPLGVRVQMLAVSRPVRTEENRDCACEGWPAALAIGEQALSLIDQADPRQAANAIVRHALRGADAASPAALESEAAATPALLEETWNALEPLLRPSPREDRRK